MYSSMKILLVEDKNIIVRKVVPCNVMKRRSRIAISCYSLTLLNRLVKSSMPEEHA